MFLDYDEIPQQLFPNYFCAWISILDQYAIDPAGKVFFWI